MCRGDDTWTSKLLYVFKITNRNNDDKTQEPIPPMNTCRLDNTPTEPKQTFIYRISKKKNNNKNGQAFQTESVRRLTVP